MHKADEIDEEELASCTCGLFVLLMMACAAVVAVTATVRYVGGQ